MSLVLFQFFTGGLADRYDRRLILGGAALVGALTSLGSALAGDWRWLLARDTDCPDVSGGGVSGIRGQDRGFSGAGSGQWQEKYQRRPQDAKQTENGKNKDVVATEIVSIAGQNRG